MQHSTFFFFLMCLRCRFHSVVQSEYLTDQDLILIALEEIVFILDLYRHSWEANWTCCSCKGVGFPSPGFSHVNSVLWKEREFPSRDQCILGCHHSVVSSDILKQVERGRHGCLFGSEQKPTEEATRTEKWSNNHSL